LGNDLGAATSDASAFASESDNGGSDDSSALESRSPRGGGGGAFPAGGAVSDRTVAPGAGADAPPFRPLPPSREVFLPCLAMGGIMAFARARWQ
jgi:hypothetical protein